VFASGHFALFFILGFVLDLLRYSFSSCVLCLPWYWSLDLYWSCSGVLSPHVLSLCLGLHHLIFGGPP
jgi:hypothetical protein